MKIQSFEITPLQLEEILSMYSNMGKNSHVGNAAVKIVQLYFQSLDPNSEFRIGQKGADLEVTYLGKTESFEIKGTADKKFSWTKLKVSSQSCHDALVAGMTLIRVTNVGSRNPTLHFMQYGEDFKLVSEPRWTLVRSRS